jgi:membrane protein YdbS with pleckstrin-like domain
LPDNQENLASALTEVSERVTVLVREEIELAKTEVTEKVSKIARGAAAVAAGAVFGIFAVVIGLGALAWGLNSAIGSLWLGFLITFGILIVLTVVAFLIAWRAFKVGAPAPTMAIEEAKKIRETISTPGPGGTN